ncbi:MULTISPECIES: fimbrial protein [Pantoea]|jgi:type 1 fimbria pilin|uniref:fimbrial protein n=1 Tax=Pantoea TaxID=53335 RepID=UPI001F2BA57D|nr:MULTISPECIES: fimbrial protein [Pantoea]UIL53201.1 type 1 fimbrial protein [Pantoea agglomerans]
MKKIQLAMIMGMVLASGSVFAADQGHGTVQFKGEIIDAPCSITADTVEQTVDLGQVSSSVLAKGGKSSPKAFNIKLEDCTITTQKTVTATFTGKGATFDTTSSLLALAGSAAGAGIAITDDNSSVIKLGTASTPYNLTTGTTEAELRYSAYLQGAADNTATPIVPGEFTSVANFTLAYE